MTSLRVVIPCLVLLAVVCAAGGVEPWRGTCVQVIDGDTVAISREGDAVTVRLADVDAPELEQPHGEEARDFLTDLLQDREVDVVAPTIDANGLTVARVKVGGRDASRELLKVGLAWTGDTRDERLVLASISARGEGLGLWQDDDPEPPWEFRERRVGPTPTPVPVIRTLREVARIVELKKNVDGRAVISGRPDDEEQAEEELEVAEGGLRVRFACERSGLIGCVKAELTEAFAVAYEGDAAGNFATRTLDLGDGAVTVACSGTSAQGHPYEIGASCQCGGIECDCTIHLLPRLPGRPSP